jgi:outer membrane biosynthesis protein TonB
MEELQELQLQNRGRAGTSAETEADIVALIDRLDRWRASAAARLAAIRQEVPVAQLQQPVAQQPVAQQPVEQQQQPVAQQQPVEQPVAEQQNLPAQEEQEEQEEQEQQSQNSRQSEKSDENESHSTRRRKRALRCYKKLPVGTKLINWQKMSTGGYDKRVAIKAADDNDIRMCTYNGTTMLLSAWTKGHIAALIASKKTSRKCDNDEPLLTIRYDLRDGKGDNRALTDKVH